MIKTILSFLFLMISPLCGASPVTEFQYLSGKGKDDAVEWDFLCTAGRKSGEWSKIPVPSHWEQHGFGGYYYGRQGSNRLDEIGKYKRTITIPDSWGGKRVRIVFEGVMTDTEVRVNGKAAGPVHQGGFYRFHYDITDLLKKGDNLLEVTVKKVSANATVEAAERKADYWVFGGIYRPVYLEALPSEFIDWMSVDAKADESFVLDVHAMHLSQADRLVARIVDAEGRPVGDEFSADLKQGADMTRLSTQVEAPALWSAETPNLYHVQVTLCDGEREVHQVTQRFGFRTFEVREG
ncbi:hypothetical protein GW813_04875, partial [bacterium]|nr:hypothetical protein [bacterium]